MKILIVFIGLLLFGIAGFWWYQSKEAGPKPEIFSKNGVALEGYDAVSFFNKAEPILGKMELSYIYKGVEWRFAQKENLSTFKATPEAYIPKYGGYCAYGTSNGYKAPTEVETWTIHEGNLYFNYNMKVKKQWLKDIDAHLKKADENWKNFKHK